MNSIDEIKDKILKSKKIAISFHTSPDGDAVGSALALLNSLLYLKKEAYIVSRDVISDNLSFLPLSEQINNNYEEPSKDTDLVIVLDCGNVDRISGNLSNYKGTVINIDHHVSNEFYGELNYVDSEAAATCEVVYLLLNKLGIDFTKKKSEIIDIGKCIYVGIVTDTGSYRHSNVTQKTHNIAGTLVELGVENSKIHSQLFDNKPFEKIKLMGNILSNIELALDNKISILTISKELAEQYSMEKMDTSDIVSIGLGINGVEVAMLLKESDEGVKASLRSKDKVDVRKVAEVFGGGGHIKAAGVMQRNTNLEDAKENLLKILKQQIYL